MTLLVLVVAGEVLVVAGEGAVSGEGAVLAAVPVPVPVSVVWLQLAPPG